jgi:hypothetical protein
VFGFPKFSEFEWNMIIARESINKNLREVDIYMFDDPEIKDKINELKHALDNDATIINTSSENLDYSYPIIKTKFDDADAEAIPYHWKGIDPLLYNLLIWAVIKLSILEMTDESSNNTKLLNHK